MNERSYKQYIISLHTVHITYSLGCRVLISCALIAFQTAQFVCVLFSVLFNLFYTVLLQHALHWLKK